MVPPFETVIDGRSSIYVFSESPFETVSRIRSLLKFTDHLPAHLKLSLLVDRVSTCSVRPQSKQSAELGYCSSLLFKFTPQVTSVIFKFTARVTFKFLLKFTPSFETVIAGRSSISSYQHHLEVHCQSHLQVKCPSSLLPVSPSGLLPSSLLTFNFSVHQVYSFTTTVTFKFTALKFTHKFKPPTFETVHIYSSSLLLKLTCQIMYWHINVFSESSCETPQVYCSRLLPKFTSQVYL